MSYHAGCFYLKKNSYTLQTLKSSRKGILCSDRKQHSALSIEKLIDQGMIIIKKKTKRNGDSEIGSVSGD